MVYAMNALTTLDNAGRIVLPAAIRRRLNLVPGTRLRLAVVAERIELVPEPELASTLIRKGGRLVLAPTGESFDAAAAVRAEREAQARHGSRE